MSLESAAQIYYDSECRLTNQLLRIQNAQLALNQYREINREPSVERHLRLIQLSQDVYNEQSLYEKYHEELGDAGLDLIEELNIINHPIGEIRQFDLPNDRYFEVYLENERSLRFLGPYSRI